MESYTFLIEFKVRKKPKDIDKFIKIIKPCRKMIKEMAYVKEGKVNNG